MKGWLQHRWQVIDIATELVARRIRADNVVARRSKTPAWPVGDSFFPCEIRLVPTQGRLDHLCVVSWADLHLLFWGHLVRIKVNDVGDWGDPTVRHTVFQGRLS